MSCPTPPDEQRRLAAVGRLAILDTPPEPQFDALTELACTLFNVPISLISIIDRDRQWNKSAYGLDLKQAPREDSICNHTIAGSDLLVIEDASRDPRFAGNPFVAGDDGIRFYAGAPLDLGDGQALGTLCIIDRSPRALGAEEAEALQRLAGLATTLLRAHRDASELAVLGRELADVTQTVSRQALSLKTQKRILDHASALACMGAWEVDTCTGRHKWSEGMYTLHEVEPDFEVTAESVESFYLEEDRRRMRAVLAEAIRTDSPYTFEGRILTAKGNLRWVRVSAKCEIVDGKVVRRHGMKQDITEEKAKAEELLRLADCDSLTGLYNRAYLQRALEQMPPSHRDISLLLLDLDGFKDINDTHGHAAGDHCLKKIAERLLAMPAPDALVARIGGDEFAVLIEHDEDEETADIFAEWIVYAVREPVEWSGHAFEISTSVGISRCAGGMHPDAAELMLTADLALYAAKGDGRNRHRRFSPEMKEEAEQRFRLINDVKQALLQGQLELHYQPKIRLCDGAHEGFEALLRWNRTDGTVATPELFGAVLDDPKLAAEIGSFVITSALDQAAAWAEAGIPFGSVAINLGAAQFRDPDLADLILTEIALRDLDPRMVEIEVTEGVFLSRMSSNVFDICSRLKACGVRVAFDDFGTGFASLTHLCECPVDLLKIDRTFTARLGRDRNTGAVVMSIIDLARKLGMKIVAEGVETEAQAEFLRAHGCDFAQGYLFGRPVPAQRAVATPTPLSNVA